uniref:Uncharacterized protein n=1 Tax=Rhizophora mucronata TaxID=61149 RepID=A0A2P2QYD9_RHIMU
MISCSGWMLNNCLQQFNLEAEAKCKRRKQKVLSQNIRVNNLTQLTLSNIPKQETLLC